MKIEDALKLANTCKKCKCHPTISVVNGLHYARCSNPECDIWGPYDFIGITPQGAVSQWNELNNDKTAKPYNKVTKELENSM